MSTVLLWKFPHTTFGCVSGGLPALRSSPGQPLLLPLPRPHGGRCGLVRSGTFSLLWDRCSMMSLTPQGSQTPMADTRATPAPNTASPMSEPAARGGRNVLTLPFTESPSWVRRLLHYSNSYRQPAVRSCDFVSRKLRLSRIRGESGRGL